MAIFLGLLLDSALLGRRVVIRGSFGLVLAFANRGIGAGGLGDLGGFVGSLGLGEGLLRVTGFEILENFLGPVLTVRTVSTRTE